QQGVAFRMDNMHFDCPRRPSVWCGGWLIGVIDSTVIHTKGRYPQGFWFGNGYDSLGNGSWADYPWFGTDKFVFVEDTTIFGSAEGVNGNVDASGGARFVIRHTYFSQCTVEAHGTDNQTLRGTRCAEIYNNVFDWDGREPQYCR